MSILTIRAIVPMIHVSSVERSAEFYRMLGFEIGNKVPPTGPMHWAWLYAPDAEDWKRGPNLMLTRSEHVIDSHAQQVLFYLYATDLVSIRSRLLETGVKAGEISYPEYLPEGEFRIEDPDGYCLMVAQAGDRTP